MTWLVVHDVLPGWTALDPPPVSLVDSADLTGDKVQYSLSLDDDSIGALWTVYLVEKDSIRREDLIWLERLPIDIAPVRIATSFVFTSDGLLDELTVRVEDSDSAFPIRLHGERFHADFSFTLESGDAIRSFKLPLSEGGLIAGMFSPFPPLKDLEVGLRWRMQVFNPIAALTGIGDRFLPLLVNVSARERIRAGAWEGDCHRVEAGAVRAWVDDDAVVRVQEMTLPIGRFRIVRLAECDAVAYSSARKARFPFPGGARR